MKIDFVLANSADPDEMPHYAAFHLSLHCLPYTHLGFPNPQRVNEGQYYRRKILDLKIAIFALPRVPERIVSSRHNVFVEK